MPYTIVMFYGRELFDNKLADLAVPVSDQCFHQNHNDASSLHTNYSCNIFYSCIIDIAVDPSSASSLNNFCNYTLAMFPGSENLFLAFSSISKLSRTKV